MIRRWLRPGPIFVGTLANTSEIAEEGVVGLLIAPLRLVAREAAPARVFAIKRM